MVTMIFKTWGKNRTSKKLFRIASSKKDRSILAGVDPRLKQIAYDKLAVLREYRFRLSRPRKPKTKTKVRDQFLADLNSGILSPDGAMNRIRHVGEATLYNWDKSYRNGGLAALIPRYKTKLSTGKAIFRPLVKPIEMKFPGRPRRNGKTEFVARIKRHWKNPPLDCPIHLSIFYLMPIPKGTKMPQRMAMLKHQVSHRGKPNLDALNAFVVDCMAGFVFRDHSQIVHFHSEKQFDWWSQTRVLIKPVPG